MCPFCLIYPRFEAEGAEIENETGIDKNSCNKKLLPLAKGQRKE